MVGLLIADDEMLERKVLYKTLQKHLGDRCDIYQAENGRQALELFDAHNIRILILDIEMPGINGIEAAERIRRKDRDCCIIFLTAFDEFSYARKAITVKAMDYLLKPYDETELLLLLEEALRLTEETEVGKGEKDGSGEEAAALGGSKEGPEKESSEKEGPEKEGSEKRSPEKEDPEKEEFEKEELENGRMWKVKEMIEHYIQENYMYDISMQDLARAMNYSEAYFCRLFKQCFGKNFTACLTEYRVSVAKTMMSLPTVNIKEIGKAVGYGDPNYFAKVFRRVTGQSPSDFRTELFRQ